MRKFKFLILICLSVISCFIFTACGFGSYDLELVLPDGTVYKTFTYGPNDAYLRTSNTPPSVVGYNFVGWSENEQLDSVITIPYAIKADKLYAKYEIDSGYFFNYSTINYNGAQTSLNVNSVLQNSYYILIKDNSDAQNISRIEIMANNSSFILHSATLRNCNAKIIAEVGANQSVLNLNETGTTQSYVIEITAALNEDFVINIY